MKKILNVIVYYDNYEEVEKYIKNALSIAKGTVDIALIVNKDTDNKSDLLTREMNVLFENKVRVFDFAENVGYLNSLLKCIQVLSKEYDYYILSNTDIRYTSDDFFDLLLKERFDDKIGCIAPNVYSINYDIYSNPHYIKRIKKFKLKRLYYMCNFPICVNYYSKLAQFKAKKKKRIEKESCYVYSPHGCYMIFTKNFIDFLKGKLYGAKMYGEESFVGEQLILSELSCYYEKNLKIIHEENTVTGKIGYKVIANYMKESYKYLLDTFY